MPLGEGHETLLRRVAYAYLPGARAVHGTDFAYAGRADEPLGSERRDLAGRLLAEVEEDSSCGACAFFSCRLWLLLSLVF